MTKATAPGYSGELGIRIATAIERAGGVIAVGRMLDVSKDTPGRWRDGESKISLHQITRLAEIADVDPAWLAFGEERAVPSVRSDMEVVEEVAETVIEIAVSLGGDIDPKRLARTIRRRAERLVHDPAGIALAGLTSNTKGR